MFHLFGQGCTVPVSFSTRTLQLMWSSVAGTGCCWLRKRSFILYVDPHQVTTSCISLLWHVEGSLSSQFSTSPPALWETLDLMVPGLNCCLNSLHFQSLCDGQVQIMAKALKPHIWEPFKSLGHVCCVACGYADQDFLLTLPFYQHILKKFTDVVSRGIFREEQSFKAVWLQLPVWGKVMDSEANIGLTTPAFTSPEVSSCSKPCSLS